MHPREVIHLEEMVRGSARAKHRRLRPRGRTAIDVGATSCSREGAKLAERLGKGGVEGTSRHRKYGGNPDVEGVEPEPLLETERTINQVRY